MGEIERTIIDGAKEGHIAITKALTALDGAGFSVGGIAYKNGVLEITCRPPKEDGGFKWISLVSNNPDKSGTRAMEAANGRN